MSFIVEVQTDSTGKWYSNYLRFPTDEQAEAYARDLSSRWTAVKDWRVSEIHQPANYTYHDGKIEPYHEKPTLIRKED